MKSWGTPLSISEFLHLAKNYASSLKKSHLFPLKTPTYDWLRSDLKRRRNLTLKKSRPLEQKRALLTRAQVNDWFSLISKTIRDNDLEDRPCQIFNCDESGNKNLFLNEEIILLLYCRIVRQY